MFFFFKQKTAYEMRISDWSSDVCSSDLPDVAVDEVGAGITFEAVAEEPTYPNSTFAVDPYVGGKAFSLRGGQTVELELPMQGIESISEIAFDISKIGRASCRERVCQYV